MPRTWKIGVDQRDLSTVERGKRILVRGLPPRARSEPSVDYRRMRTGDELRLSSIVGSMAIVSEIRDVRPYPTFGELYAVEPFALIEPGSASGRDPATVALARARGDVQRYARSVEYWSALGIAPAYAIEFRLPGDVMPR